jgi:hypothetical protein
MGDFPDARADAALQHNAAASTGHNGVNND